jgi:hypothetical protein
VILHGSSPTRPASHPVRPCLDERWPWQPLQTLHLSREGVKKMEATAISHIAICTRDMEKSLAFYRDILGMQVLADAMTDPV